MDKFEALKVFTAVASEGSFVSASQALGISAPAVTRAVARLEKDLSIRLFHRTTRAVRLTEAGQGYLRDARAILEQLEEADASVRGTYGELSGTLTLTAPVLFGQLYVVPVIREFVDQHPHVRVDTLFLDRVTNLLEDNFDLAVRLGSLADSSLFSRQVGLIRKVTCASPEYLQRHGRPEQPQDLTDHAIVHATAVEASTVWRYGEERIRVSPSFRCNQNGAAVEAALMSMGITRVMSYQVADAIASGALELILQENEPEPVPASLVYLEGRAANAKVRAFVDLATTLLGANERLNPA